MMERSLPICGGFAGKWEFDGSRRGWWGCEQPSQRQSRERLAFPRWGGGESCAYPKLSDSRPSSAQRAPVVPRLDAHVPIREKPTTDCRREDCPSLKGIRTAGGRWEKCEVRGTSKRGWLPRGDEKGRGDQRSGFHEEMKRDRVASAGSAGTKHAGVYSCGCQIKIFRAIQLYSRVREFSLFLFLSFSASPSARLSNDSTSHKPTLG